VIRFQGLQRAGSSNALVFAFMRQTINEVHANTEQLMSGAAEFPDEILTGLFLSNLESRKNEDILRMLNITTICDLSTLPPFMMKPPKFSGILVHEYSVLDDEESDIMPAARQVLAVIAAQRQQPSSGSVLVHCQGGVSRSAAAVIYSLMALDSLSLAIAYRFVRSKRPCIRPNAGFLRQLIAAGADLGRELFCLKCLAAACSLFCWFCILHGHFFFCNFFGRS
jgi:predicted protein tyrosine phosphatase